MDNYIRVIDVVGLQNIELELANLLKEEKYHRIISVSLEGRDIKITFSAEDTLKKYPNFVKQVSKKKYQNFTEFMLCSQKFGNGALLKAVISVGDKWLLFFVK